jgi:hypothetical protein
MIILNHKQGSDDWLESKIGILGGTRVKKIITPAQMQLSASHIDLLDVILDENITGISNERYFSTPATERGNELEPMARAAYIAETGININEHGLCLSDKNNLHGCSPDGFTDDFTGGIEIKCPGHVHLKYGRDKQIPTEYKLQIINYFLVNEKLEWLDFVSFRPEFYPLPLVIIRVTREQLAEPIEKVGAAIDTFFEAYYTLRDQYLF